MSNRVKQVYQFKITLVGIKPAIWRRLQILETSTFEDFHSAIQSVMGWEGYHLHQFRVTNPKTGCVDTISDREVLEDEDVVEEGKKKLSSYFSQQNKKALYEYDFGDSWEHTILLEKILPLDLGKEYPVCLAGERARPPEDCGGIWGYEHLLEIIRDPDNPEYKDRIEWLGGSFDPEEFKIEEVVFES
jgi:hypothetical protein